ncbi:MAG TPA: gamma carbonic anhydrase family protein [Deltaproteobacteria bacterium]|nr:gamma carbonic anhydrase family protein [Deltaproteobacteria bacterium]HOI06431.1 gamma carbonic anhydrase family protein [Deltaproteobacteria bacterium]
MPIYAFDGKKPVVGDGTWVAPSAYIIGNVTIGSRCWIGPGAVIRGDFGAIVIGDDTAVEDGVVIHTPALVTIGKAVTIGHSALIHGRSVGDYAVVGMHSTLGDNSVVGSWSIVAEHSLVKKNQVVPDSKLYAGVPAVEKGDISQQHRDIMLLGKQMYTELAARYLSSLERLD